MQRLLRAVPAAALLAVTLEAQCPGTPATIVPWDNFFGYAATLPPEDEGLSNPPIALPFAFPMPGAAGTLDQLWIHSNGELYLTDSSLGLTEPVDGITFSIIALPELQGAIGGSARIAVCSRDHDQSFAPGANWSISVDTSMPGEVRVLWTDVARWNTSDRYSFQCTLFANGLIRLDYDAATPAAATWVGVSVGNAEPSTAGSLDFTALPSSPLTEGILYETFTAATWDLSGQSVFLVPDFTPGAENYLVQAVVPFGQGPCATHSPYGTGCYPIARETFYELFADAAVASAALQGHSMTIDPTPDGYVAVWNPGGATGFVAPAAATDLLRSDDGQELIDLAALALSPLPTPAGAVTALYVHMNGFVSTGPTNDNGNWNVPPNDYTPTIMFRSATETAFWSWHDYNPADLAGGPVRRHHDPALDVLYVTWDGVENYSAAPMNNPGTIQFQFHLAGSSTPGRVVYVWPAVDTDTTSAFGSAHLVGYSPAGPSLDPGAIALSTALPIVTAPDVLPSQLSAAPRPVINPSTLVTYTATRLPEFLPGSGVYLSTMFLSLNPLPGGVDLGIIGAPGCNAYIATLDLDLGGQVTLTPTATWNVLFDNVVFAPGNVVHAQAIALVQPNSLPNGQNAFGMTVSNGVTSTTEVN